MNHPDRPLESPFTEGDKARSQLEQALLAIEQLQKENRFIIDCLAVLMRIEKDRGDANVCTKV